jgi:hypothetical protein
VQINSAPANATVKLEGREVGRTPYTSIALKPGPLVFKVSSDGYEELDLKVQVLPNGQIVTNHARLTLVPADYVVVEFRSQPPGALITEGTNQLCTTDAFGVRKYLPPGSHTIAAKFEDWPPMVTAPVTNKVNVVAGNNAPVEFSIPYGWVTIDSKPEEVDVLVNKKSLGAVRKPLPVGDYTLSVEHSSYEPYQKQITITKGETTRVPLALKMLLGSVEITSDPPGATIFETKTGRRELGRTQPGQPLKASFPPGSYSFAAQYEGLDSIPEQSADVPLGKHVSLPPFSFKYATVTFETEPPNAKVQIAGVPVGETRYVRYLRPGPLSYKLELPDYLPIENATNLADRQSFTLSIALARRPVDIELQSDPPGAQFYLVPSPSSASALVPGTKDHYSLPWGTNHISARHPLFTSLTPVTNSIVLAKTPPNRHQFKFDYGLLVLTNIPEEVTIKESGIALTAVSEPVRLAYVRPGRRTYDLYDGEQKIESVTTDVPLGLAAVLRARTNLTEMVGEIRNGIGMRLVKVRNLLGPGKDGWVGKYEVTQAEYQTVMGNNPSAPPLGDNFPVQNVNWDQAMEFCQKLKAHDQKKPPARGDYTLPSFEQWQIFAAGTDRTFKDAVVGATAPLPVGSKPANPQRLHDVLGNVWEWLTNGEGMNRIFIGAAYNVGSFGRQFGKWESRNRAFVEPNVGFRVILIPTNAPAATASTP